MKSNLFYTIFKYTIYFLLYFITTTIILIAVLGNYADYNRFIAFRMIIITFAVILLVKYFIYMLISPWYDVIVAFNAKKFRYKRYNPKVSVLIPAWNEEVGILTTIRSILRSSYKNTEIVVVNDGSTDNSDKLIRDFIKDYYHKLNLKEAKRRARTKENAESLVKKSRIEIIYKYKSNAGKGHSLNTAIDLSSGDILMSIDADCVVGRHTVKNFVHHFRNPQVMAAVGNVKIANTDTILGTIQYLEFLFSFYFKKADSIMNVVYIIGGAAGAFRREVFEKLGKYNTTNITEDIDLSVRIQNAGMKIVYASKAIVWTEGAVRIGDLLKQRLRWKRGRFETFSDFKHMFFSVNKKHNKILTLIIFPLAIFGEIHLFLELFFLTFLYVYSFLTGDFSSFVSGIIFVSAMFLIKMIFDEYKNIKLRFILLAPIGWLLFYVSTFVETVALLKSLVSYIRKQEVKWQRWERTGISK